MAEASATAEGELARTPLAHLLVYALDRRLTGGLFLAPPGGEEHVVRLARGVPIKVRPGNRFALLGEMLVEAGAIDEKTLEAALATKGLLGDVLLLAGRVERDVLEKVAEEQFVRRMVRLFALPAETTYRYYDGHEALEEYGGDPACVDPLALLWGGLRTHGEVSAMMEGTLARLGEVPLKLHPAATVARFGLDAEEARLLEELGTRPITLPELCAASFPGLARRFAYALAITRQIEMGTGLLPLGVEVPAASAQRAAPAATAVGRMALRSTVHRIGAAAPDAPGDGERVPVITPSRRSRERTAAASPDEPSSNRTSALPPVSSVEPVPQDAPGPDSGVVAVAPAAEPVALGETSKPPPSVVMAETIKPPGDEVVQVQPVDRATTIESATLRSGLDPSIEALRASVPDIEETATEAPEDLPDLEAAPGAHVSVPDIEVALAEEVLEAEALAMEAEADEAWEEAPPAAVEAEAAVVEEAAAIEAEAAVEETPAVEAEAAVEEAPAVEAEAAAVETEAAVEEAPAVEAEAAAEEAPAVEAEVATEEAAAVEAEAAAEEAAAIEAEAAAEEAAAIEAEAAAEETPAVEAEAAVEEVAAAEEAAAEEAPVVEAEAADDPFAEMSPPELFWLATECLAQQDVAGAVEACEAGRREAPDDPDLVALGAWARAQIGAADLKALTIELDEVLGAHEEHVEARYYRGMLRKRLGDQAGCRRDLEHVVQIAPGHQGACEELESLGPKPAQKLRPSLFGKLFKR